VRLILSASSDIGTAIALNWLESNHRVIGTYRTWSSNCDLLQSKGVMLIHCDLLDSISFDEAVSLVSEQGLWDTLLIAPGDQNPIGLFENVHFSEWESSIIVNFIRPMEFIHKLLRNRSREFNEIPTVLMFAGGGTNSATSNYSAYTISKIASIKMAELLDFEIEDCKFVIIGPGWVESKIHDATIVAGFRAGDNFEKTVSMREGGLMNPISNVIDACNWAIVNSKLTVGGRNFSAVHDDFSSDALKANLLSDSNFFKLRRKGNGIYDRKQ